MLQSFAELFSFLTIHEPWKCNEKLEFYLKKLTLTWQYSIFILADKEKKIE